MEFLDRIGEYFVAFTAWIERLLTMLFGASNERAIRRLGFVRRGQVTTITPGSILDRIAQLEPTLQQLSDDELRQTTPRLRARLKAGETLDDVLVDAFAAVRESGRRYLRMRHYDVQMIGGYFLHKGNIAEMMTGEGKTLVATLPAFLNALAGHVHLVTVNDYLARRDMEWMAPLYMGLGLTVGCIQSQQDPEEKIRAYECDITYGTNNEFGFDYLRDNMKPARKGDPNYPADRQQVQGPLEFAIVDEIDNILIDEARTPLIISGPAHDDVDKYRLADRVARQLRKDVDFEIKEKEHTCHLSEEGVRRAEELAGVESFYTAGNMEWPHLIDNSLRAHHLYKRDVNYVVMQGEVIIVDEFTGRLMKGRQWSDGLHQAVEAKEGVKIKEETQTYATITLQNYFKLYKKLAGMTGTAMTEANEFYKIYKLDVVAIPTNRPSARINYPDVIFRSEREKFNAIVDEIKDVHETGRPILVGTVSIEKSELVSDRLKKLGIPHEVLNAKYHEREADIIAQAGRLAAVTIATNMAGRGTDIILGGNPETLAWNELKHTYANRLEVPKAEFDALSKKIAQDEGMDEEGRKVAAAGGLHVIGTERHEARRIDLQLRGRAGRQGDPGSSRFFLSLEDDLMRIFAGEWVKNMLTRLGMQEGEAIESGLVTSRVEAAQRKVEERHFEQRKHLLEYDEVMDQQRKRVYGYRQRILDGVNCRVLIEEMLRQEVSRAVDDLIGSQYGRATVVSWAAQALGIEITEGDLRSFSAEDAKSFLRDESKRQAEDLLREKIDEDLPEDVEDQREWNFGALSKWANTRYGLNTNDRELRKIGRETMFDTLIERIHAAIDRADLSPVDTFLSDDFGRTQLSSWLAQQFTLDIPPKQFEGLSVSEARDLILTQLDELYRRKEVEFPVAVALSNFMAEGSSNGDRYNRDGLATWANDRFNTAFAIDEFRSRPRDEVRQMLTAASRDFYKNGETLGPLDQYLNQAYTGSRPETDGAGLQGAAQPQALSDLAAWVDREFQVRLDLEELQSLPRESARLRVLEEIDDRYRPELRHAERSLILEVLDTAWKDHLYFMDHLRQGIGLKAYAQQDPKVEYKREGMRAFDQMWKRIAHEVTGAIFRLERESPDFVGSLWQITATTHAAPPPPTDDMPLDGGDGSPSPSAPGSDQPLEPIKHSGPRVGRNDPCPCGSGKKFKTCHGRR